VQNQSKIRVRKHTFELLVELVYRLELNLLGKKSEFGDLKPDTRSAISNLLSASRIAKTSIEKNCLLNPDFSTRSKELNSILDSIEMLKEAEVLSINGAR